MIADIKDAVTRGWVRGTGTRKSGGLVVATNNQNIVCRKTDLRIGSGVRNGDPVIDTDDATSGSCIGGSKGVKIGIGGNCCRAGHETDTGK